MTSPTKGRITWKHPIANPITAILFNRKFCNPNPRQTEKPSKPSAKASKSRDQICPIFSYMYKPPCPCLYTLCDFTREYVSFIRGIVCYELLKSPTEI